MAIQGVSHMTFICRDITKMARILTEVLGLNEVYCSRGAGFSLSAEKFFVSGDIWIAVMQGESLPERSYNHIAFKVDDAEIEPAMERIRSLGLDVRPPRPRIAGEGRSVYFYDEDNHLFELHSGTLEERLAAYARHTGAEDGNISVT
ncbi:FosX/FosE/FosI family fosfomycin resistance hydrolase [Pannonibacter phragmitetus]|uniref:FosX/FosE/FosI family fosfomycin resistance hydrolase n=1 Tax=Pannonibacter phragmitetus TaxID=121719 RepID=UPI003D2EF762